eukprot:Trichotokara_eunicae@DN4261_c0_g1_i2.p1
MMLNCLGLIILWMLIYTKNVYVLVVVFILRGSFQNCVTPIDRSLIMDFTPSTERGFWNALSSMNSATWSGSAFIGGALADVRDYRETFKVTAYFYFVSMLVYFPLMFIVPPHGETPVEDMARKKKEKRSVNMNPERENHLDKPLLCEESET